MTTTFREVSTNGAHVVDSSVSRGYEEHGTGFQQAKFTSSTLQRSIIESPYAMGDSSAVVDEKSFPGPGHAVQITPAAPVSSTKSALGPSLDNRTYIRAIPPIYVNVAALNVGVSSDGSSSATSESSSEASGGRRKRPFVHLLLEITAGVGSIVECDDLAFSHDPCGSLCSPTTPKGSGSAFRNAIDSPCSNI